MKVKEIIKDMKDIDENICDYDIYRYTDNNNKKLHTDYIQAIYEDYENLEVKEYYILDEKEYNETILANSSIKADFKEWFNDENAKILVIIVE